MTNSKNCLCNSELERLALVAEEAAEVSQMAMKIIRHGYSNFHPADKDKVTNRYRLAQEIADLKVVLQRMEDCGDVVVHDYMVERARQRKSLYTYYQTEGF